ncbi:helix-turn-helix domain-containing protein [Tomitella cavernea]|uniref:Helix-turn-helix domain-containing protein n=1 Tax=Tomitella cavernea TaxID=1387982 RepID=A0ABP9CP45_9ACTN|nr:helix-turn-helix domain-containing protein [Tomitella cavernea]
MPASSNHTILPLSAGGDVYVALRAVLAERGDLRLSGTGSGAVLPPAARAVLADAVDALARGDAVTVEPRRTVLTTQEAAGLLGITRPTFVRLLEAGRIPYTTPGRHRRVELADVLDYRRNQRDQRRQALQRMADEATPDPEDVADGFIETR